MIRRNFSWFHNRAKVVWENNPGQSLLVIVPNGCDENLATNQIEKYVQDNFNLCAEDGAFEHKIFKITPDSVESSEHFVNNIVRAFEKCLGKPSEAHGEEYLSNKIETAVDELNNQNIHPILLIKRFISFARIQDKALTSTLGKLREMEHDKKLTSIIISPINYHVLRQKMANDPRGVLPFINSPYGDNHEKIIIEPIVKEDFISFAVERGIDLVDAESLYSIGGGLDLVYENLVKNQDLGQEALMSTCVNECHKIFERFFADCELSNRVGLLNRLAQNVLTNNDIAYLNSTDLTNFIIHLEDQLGYQISSPIMKDTILTKILLNNSDVPLHVFDMAIKTLLATKENQEIEFKPYFLETKRQNNAGKMQTQAELDLIILKEITGFMNANDGVLLIGVLDGQNTKSKNDEIIGIDDEMLFNDCTRDEYELKITERCINAFGAASAGLITPKLEIVDGKTVCRIEIKKSPEPIYLKKPKKGWGDLKGDGNYVRRDSTSRLFDPRDWQDHCRQNFP